MQIDSISLVSVVIPCYNHGHYLPVAVESVLSQSYKNIEVIVVDDGSNDNTWEVAQSYGNRVRYVYKQNAGLSAARNTGIDQAKGNFVLFLDADDWLYPNAIQVNVQHLLDNPKAAFVSGAHDKIFEEENVNFNSINTVTSNHYIELLQGNYIGMVATVLFQRWVLDIYRFDEELKACEDYDLYLRIARSYPVLHHTEKVATYRIHSNSMSSDISKMIRLVKGVLSRQRRHLQTSNELFAYKLGHKNWKSYYCRELYLNLRKKRQSKLKSYVTLLKHKPRLFFQYIILYLIRKRK